MKTDAGADDPLDRLDQLVAAAPEPENTVLTDNARLVRWAGPSFLLFSLIMLPWTIYIGLSLPARQLSPNYDLAWAGFDVILLSLLAATGVFALRRSRYLASAASATAALLVVDAWFDCMTTPGADRLQSFVLCGLIELPLAGVCLWLSWHTMHIAEQRIVLLQRHRAGHPRRGRGAWARRGHPGHRDGAAPRSGGN
jgi:hypothetical protein